MAGLPSTLGRDLARHQALQADIAALEADLEPLPAGSGGQVLTTLPGVAVVRAAGFAAHSLPINRYPDAEHLYSATGLAPALYESATIRRRGRISRQGLAEHRDALMGIAWGLSRSSPSFAATRPRVPQPRHHPDPSQGRAGPARLPPRLPAAHHPRTLR
jgi:transposase